jgi:hypothetical protein|tara:strand:+ start:20152 stop:20313 length:162 start_codon:yes stop_codon:yes gene_type:complete
MREISDDDDVMYEYTRGHLKCITPNIHIAIKRKTSAEVGVLINMEYAGELNVN